MSFPRGSDHYGGGQYYKQQLHVHMSGRRMSENFGERTYDQPDMEPHEIMEEDMSMRAPLPAERDYPANEDWHDDEYHSKGIPVEHEAEFVEAYPQQGFSSAPLPFDDPQEQFESFDSTYAEENKEANTSEALEMFSPIIGEWSTAADFSTTEYAIQRMIKNRNNVFDISSHMEYTLANGSKTRWTLENEWGKDGKNKPYAYSGSPYGANRVINRVWLLNARHNGDVSQTLHFSMANSLTSAEMFKPIIPVLVSTHEEGPTHVVLYPGEKLECPKLLWYRSASSKRSPVILRYPKYTEEKLREELGYNSNPKETKYVKNLSIGKSVLLEYIKDKCARGDLTNPLMPVYSEGYYKIPNAEAENFIQQWKIEKSCDLTVEHLYNLVVKPNRAVRSSPESSTFHEDVFQDKAEIMSKIAEWEMESSKERKLFADRFIKSKPITVYWTIRVELVPQKETTDH